MALFHHFLSVVLQVQQWPCDLTVLCRHGDPDEDHDENVSVCCPVVVDSHVSLVATLWGCIAFWGVSAHTDVFLKKTEQSQIKIHFCDVEVPQHALSMYWWPFCSLRWMGSIAVPLSKDPPCLHPSFVLLLKPHLSLSYFLALLKQTPGITRNQLELTGTPWNHQEPLGIKRDPPESPRVFFLYYVCCYLMMMMMMKRTLLWSTCHWCRHDRWPPRQRCMFSVDMLKRNDDVIFLHFVEAAGLKRWTSLKKKHVCFLLFVCSCWPAASVPSWWCNIWPLVQMSCAVVQECKNVK